MAKMTYEWSDGSRLTGDPDVVGRALEKVRRKSGLSATSVLDEARNPGSVLHNYFEWDNTEAAEQYRLEQARRLIRAVVRIDLSDDLPAVRAFVKLSDETEYEPIREVLSDQERRVRLLTDVKARLKAVKEKLSTYQDYVDVIAALDKVEASITRKVVVAKKSARKTSARKRT